MWLCQLFLCGQTQDLPRCPEVRGHLSRGSPLAAVRDYEPFPSLQKRQRKCPMYFKNQKIIDGYEWTSKQGKLLGIKKGGI